MLPHSALLILAARSNTPFRDEWWNDMVARLRRGPIGVQETSAIASMTKCARDRVCAFPQHEMIAVFDAVLSHGGNAEIRNIRADYALNVLRRPDEALQLWRSAIEMSPGEGQYRINRAKALIALGRYAEARTEIAALRAMDRVGHDELAARELEERLRRAEASHQPPT